MHQCVGNARAMRDLKEQFQTVFRVMVCLLKKNKQLLKFTFVISEIIKVTVGKCYRPRPSARP